MTHLDNNGSETVRLTDDPEKDRNPSWSPDGRRALTAARDVSAGAWIFDVSAVATRENATFFRSPMTSVFRADAWSPDGAFVAGSVLDETSAPRQPAVWEMSTGRVREFKVPPPLSRFAGAVAGWLPGSRRFLFASGKGLVAIDAQTGTVSPFAAPEDTIRYRLSRDGRTLLAERDTLDADIWLIDFGTK